MLTETELLQLYQAFRDDFVSSGRETRYDTMIDVLNREWGLKDAIGDPLDPASPNLIGTALEDTAEAASVMPTIRVRPPKVDAKSKATAALMEQIAMGYFDVSQMELMIPRLVMHLGGFGLAPIVVLPDFDRGTPVIQQRDPWLCFPEPRNHPGDFPNRVILARAVEYGSLPQEYRDLIEAEVKLTGWEKSRSKVVLVEYYSDEEITTGALLSTGRISTTSPSAGWKPVILDQVENPIGVCPVIPMARITWDREYRGQFDHVIDSMLAYARTAAMFVDYSEQTVYSDMWVKDPIGEVSFGGAALIELGTNGAIGRVPPAQASLDFWRMLDKMEDQIHVGGRWPKSRPGQVDQAIASGKFVEATVGMMSTVIKTHHQVLARGLAQALRLCFATDIAYFGGKAKSAVGVLRNHPYTVEYVPSTAIDQGFDVKVEYGLGLGRDANSSAVLMMNYAKEEYISDEFVQENIDGLTDVAREQTRIDLKRLRQMMFSALLQGVEQGTIPVAKLPEIYAARESGDDIVTIFQELFPEQPEGEAAGDDPLAMLMEQMGLGAAPPPGPVGAGGPPGGSPFPPDGLPVPVPPDARQSLNRINVPAGPGALIGSQVMG